jgi:hypothetical protein
MDVAVRDTSRGGHRRAQRVEAKHPARNGWLLVVGIYSVVKGAWYLIRSGKRCEVGVRMSEETEIR